MITVGVRFLLTASALALATAAHAGETITYKYDALDRLVEQSSTGSVNNGQKTQLCYDPAGNRSTYTVAGVGGPAPPPSACHAPPPPGPPPPPPPPPGNQPPTTVADTASIPKCGNVTWNVVSNDTDPEGNYPLSPTGVSYSGPRGTASLANGTSIYFESNGTSGTAAIIYTVQDSLGATSTGTFTVTITTVNSCP